MKKKILILFVLLSSFFFLIAGNNNDNSNNLLEVKEVEAATIPTSAGTTLYFNAGSEWDKDNARFAAYFFGNGEKWVSMTKIKNHYFKVEIPSGGYTKVIFCRMNGANSTNNWNNKWNQTGNLNLGEGILFTITTPWNGDAKGTWQGKYVDVYFATDSSSWTAPYANCCLSADDDIWENKQMSSTGNKYRNKTIYKASVPAIYGGLDKLQFQAAKDSGTNKYSIGSEQAKSYKTISQIEAEDLYYYGTASGESSFTGWKSKVDTVFNVNDVSGTTHIVEDCYEDDIIAAPTVTRDDGYTFAGWYDNDELSGVSIGTFLSGKQYWASWGIVFTPGSTIYVIPNQKWLSKGTVAIDLYGAGRNDFYDMEKIVNMDGSVVYSFTIPTQIEGQTPEYTNAIILWVKESVVGYTIDNRWSNVIAQTNDLTQSEDGYLGYEIGAYQNNSVANPKYDATDNPKPRFGGEWVEMGSLIISNHNCSEQPLTLVHKVGHSISSFNITAPVNKSFMGFEDDGGNSVELSFPLTITNTPVIYNENWIDANYAHSDFILYYKECSTKENSYGVQPFYAGLSFYTDENITYYGSDAVNKYYYYLTLKENGTNKVQGRYDTYEALLADLADFDLKYSCLDADGLIDRTNFDKEYQLILTIVERANSSVVVVNSVLNSLEIRDVNKPITFNNLIDQYIYDQRTVDGYEFDLVSDNEDKAVYQLHVHTYSTSDDLNEKYINDALYLYQSCYVCGHKEKVEGVTVTWVKNNDNSYTYTTTVENKPYTFTSPKQLTYIYESKTEKYNSDTRVEAYAVFSNEGILINEFKSLYDAIEACYDYDEKVRSYNGDGSGSYVVKIIDGEYDNIILFRNRQSYIYDSNPENENTDMYWYYRDGASIQRYEYWASDYWTSLLASNKFISIQRKADLKSTADVSEAEIRAHAASYSIFAKNTSVDNGNISQVYNYCYGLDSNANIFFNGSKGITDIRFYVNLKNARIYPSYDDSDNAWAYIGYASFASDFIMHQGLKCDTRTGNWYYYAGIVTNTENGIEIKELEFEGVTDICYMTSTLKQDENGEYYYQPNENINIAIYYGSSQSLDENGVQKTKTIVGTDGKSTTYPLYIVSTRLQVVFDDGRTINNTESVESVENTATFRLTFGLDVDTTDDLADYMCGAQFTNVVLTYGQAYISASKTTIHNVHNVYSDVVSNDKHTYTYLLTDANRNSTLYNNIVSTMNTNANGLVCASGSPNSGNTSACNSPTYVGDIPNGTTMMVPVYNFSYRTISSSKGALAPTLQTVKDYIDSVNEIETIVENDYLDYLEKEISYTEYSSKVDEAEYYYDALHSAEQTVFQVSFPDPVHINLYNRYLVNFNHAINEMDKFSFMASGNIYNYKDDEEINDTIHVPGKVTGNKEYDLTGQLSYNVKTNTHSLILSLPLYGRFRLYYDDVLLTTANATDDQRLVEVSGLFNNKKKADWTQKLYTDSNDYVMICSKSAGSTYQIDFHAETNKLNISQSENQTLNFVGPYRYHSSSTNVIYREYNRLVYKYYDNDNSGVFKEELIGSEQYATYNHETGFYEFTTDIYTYEGIMIYFDGELITKNNTVINGIYSTGFPGDKAYIMYTWENNNGVLMSPYKDGNTAVYKSYKFMYDPVSKHLFILPVETSMDFVSASVISSALSLWIYDSTNNGLNANNIIRGTDSKWIGNGWRMYVVVDKDGIVAYSVVYPPNGFNSCVTPTHYVHPKYLDYYNNPALNTFVDATTGEFTWQLVVPKDGFAITAHQDGTSIKYMNELAKLMTFGKTTTVLQDEWNSYYTLDEGLRLSYSSTTTDKGTTYHLHANYVID